MALDAISSNDLLNFMIYDTIYSNPLKHSTSLQDDHSILDHPSLNAISYASMFPSEDAMVVPMLPPPPPPPSCFLEKCENPGNQTAPNLATQGRKKRRRRNKVCKNKEKAETQRMSHIVVERNRRKLMNDHLSVLRSLMPHSYAQKGDQASIVGGAIEYVKELEHLLQSLQAHKFILLNQGGGKEPTTTSAATSTTTTTTTDTAGIKLSTPPFGEFFSHPQYTWSKSSTKSISKAEIEVTLMESHANLKILSRRCPRQLPKLVAGFHLLHMSILHLNVASLDALVLYSISAKVEEGCQLTCVDDIAEATNHMLGIIEEEATHC